ncbi:efflux RND transporter periplasmic adaptor subunit [Acidithiobacillus caldus]|uniref:efflux RND transporter periplasmic adaptor subunit n=2 Tax=Acidithiobacillus caldus TaxID=33059 RepID=UPI001C073CC1|nr:efflux RND transporter periplasmic adaptor subunit [Acidithiobacillus caldus]MBU2790924.1 efflux RND transporter periplasmic adaptor subunit [Acidithiobacillus caldus]
MNAAKRPWLAGGLVLALSLGLAACGMSPREAPTAGATVQAQVLTLKSSAEKGYSSVPGTVVAAQQVQLSSRLSGYLRHLDLRVGQAVQRGQLLFEVDPATADSQVQQARASLAQAEANLANARSNYERFKHLYAQGAIPAKQWDEVQAQYRMAEAQAAAARAGIASAQANLGYARVTAPFAGVITEKFLQNGDLVAPGRPVLTLADPSHLEVQASVGSRLFAALRQGETVPVLADGHTIDARVLDLVAVADSETHTHLVKLTLPADSPVQAGDYVQVQIPSPSRQGISVPRSALLDRAGIPGVFVVDAKGIAHYRLVRPGAEVGSEVEILAGLVAGERIVVDPSADLINGSRVVPAGAQHG